MAKSVPVSQSSSSPSGPPAGDSSGIETRIGLLADQFARDVLAVIRGSRLDELMAVAQSSGGANLLTRRATDALALAAASLGATTLGSSASFAPTERRRRRWPTCGETGCTNSYYPASGTSHLCYKHFIASGGKHPNSRR